MKTVHVQASKSYNVLIGNGLLDELGCHLLSALNRTCKIAISHLAKNGPEFDREMVITRCIALKRDVVAVDEFDSFARQKLNLGHTIGHSIELLSNFTITHGQAVAIVHISNVDSRESFRKISYVSLASENTFKGQGINGYRQAIVYLANKYGT